MTTLVVTKRLAFYDSGFPTEARVTTKGGYLIVAIVTGSYFAFVFQEDSGREIT